MGSRGERSEVRGESYDREKRTRTCFQTFPSVATQPLSVSQRLVTDKTFPEDFLRPVALEVGVELR
jgi:hypothetical protein